MVELWDLRRIALEIFTEALWSVDPAEAVRSVVKLRGSRLKICDTTVDLAAQSNRIYSIAIGKAAWPMACALDGILKRRLVAGVISAPSMRPTQGSLSGESRPMAEAFKSSVPSWLLPTERWQIFAGGHPLPNQQSLNAARAAFDLLQRAEEERALVIFLISGGGSAMIESPSDPAITLADLCAANKVLVTCGAAITEINAVRRAFSSVKGGKLSALAPRARQITLIVSDTPSGQEAAVASGPTMKPSTDEPTADAVLSRHDLRARLPPSILRAIDRATAQTPDSDPLLGSSHHLLLDNQTALEAAAGAARHHGYAVEIAHDISDQPIVFGCEELLSRVWALRNRLTSPDRIACLISGGEFACPVRGSGLGGRNAETVLRMALQLEALRTGGTRRRYEPSRTVMLSAGTDGIDGNSPAAGAVSDETTLARASALNLDAREYLASSDNHTFFQALGDAIITGPTGTNVRDLRIIFAEN